MDKKDFSKLYEAGQTISQIAMAHNCCNETVRLHLHKENVPIRKYRCNFNRNYFNVIDTPMHFYILGFFAADGSIQQNERSLGVVFTSKDHDILHRISKAVNHHNPTFTTRKKDDVQTFVLSDTRMAKQLIKLGFPPSKSKTLQYPSWITDHKYEKYFIMGLFDGDGSLVKYASGDWSVRFYGTKSVTIGVQQFFNKRGVNLTVAEHGKNLWVARCSGRNKSYLVMETMDYYSFDNTMTRKKNRSLELKELQ